MSRWSTRASAASATNSILPLRHFCRGPIRMTKENSLRIDFLKFVCAILVVAIHTPFPKGEVWSCSWILCHIFSKLTCVAVPFFFLCSGYFLAKHLDTQQNWWRAVRKRVRTLVVPFLIWTWIFAAYLILIRCATDLLLGRPLGSTAFDFINWLSLFGIDWRNYTLLGPLWYVRDLFFLVLTAPIISYFIKKMGIAWVALCFCGAILYWLIPGEAARHFFYYDYSLSGLFYFSCGIYLFRRNRELLFPRQNKLMGGGGSLFYSLSLARYSLRQKDWTMRNTYWMQSLFHSLSFSLGILPQPTVYRNG